MEANAMVLRPLLIIAAMTLVSPAYAQVALVCEAVVYRMLPSETPSAGEIIGVHAQFPGWGGRGSAVRNGNQIDATFQMSTGGFNGGPPAWAYFGDLPPGTYHVRMQVHAANQAPCPVVTRDLVVSGTAQPATPVPAASSLSLLFLGALLVLAGLVGVRRYAIE
jgi:hypothetical protein